MAAKRGIFWAIYREGFGFYCGTYLTKRDAIISFVHGRFRSTESEFLSFSNKLSPMQRKDWKLCEQQGDRAVRVHVSLIEESP